MKIFPRSNFDKNSSHICWETILVYLKKKIYQNRFSSFELMGFERIMIFFLNLSLYTFRLFSFVWLSVQKKTHFQYCHFLFFPPHEGQVTKAILKMRKNELWAKRITAEWRIGGGERILL